jgi:hypothetical protein
MMDEIRGFKFGGGSSIYNMVTLIGVFRTTVSTKSGTTGILPGAVAFTDDLIKYVVGPQVVVTYF